jgi:mannose-6-phosphate isomerase-like protein (cupin superfamily)
MVNTVEKGWGREIIFATNESYCGKLLVFDKAGAKCSMHYHIEKDETWYVQEGSFTVKYIDTNNAEVKETFLNKGSVWRNTKGLPHQLIAMEKNSIIFEVSTADKPSDNYRVFPGDSQ